MRKALLLATLLVTVNVAAGPPREGYRGFLELTHSSRNEVYRFVDFVSAPAKASYWGIGTSHGYQCLPQLFTGFGIDIEYCNIINTWIIPMYLHLRTDLQFGRFSPYAEIRGGVNMSQGVGPYFSPTIGYRLNWGRKLGINLGVGFTYINARNIIKEQVTGSKGEFSNMNTYEKVSNKIYFSTRIGMEF